MSTSVIANAHLDTDIHHVQDPIDYVHEDDASSSQAGSSTSANTLSTLNIDRTTTSYASSLDHVASVEIRQGRRAALHPHLSVTSDKFKEAAKTEYDMKEARKLQTSASGSVPVRLPFLVVAASGDMQFVRNEIQTIVGHASDVERWGDGVYVAYCSVKKAKQLATKNVSIRYIGLLEKQHKLPLQRDATKMLPDDCDVTVVAHFAAHARERGIAWVCEKLARIMHVRGIESRVLCQGQHSIAVTCDSKHYDEVSQYLASLPIVLRIERYAQPKFFEGSRKKFLAGIPPGSNAKPVMLSEVQADKF
jgi:hypothetical protein